MRLNINYEELKKAIDIYDDGIDKGHEYYKKGEEYGEEGNDLKDKWKYNFTSYRGKSKSQDTQIDLIEDIFDNIIWGSAISSVRSEAKYSKYLEDGEKKSISYKDIRRFGRYYRSLLNNVRTYDEEQDGTYDEGSIEKALKKNLSLGALGAASKNYRSLMRLYGKKKANSILKKAKKETGAKVVVKTKVAKVKNKKGKVERTYKKYSIVAKKDKGSSNGSGASKGKKISSNGSGASTGAKKSKKSKTVTVKQTVIKKKK